IIADTNPGLTVPFGFAGGLHDRDTGLVRFGHRDYSPELGRFVAKDPIDFAGGKNLYAYTTSDPVNFIDPLGLYGVCPEKPPKPRDACYMHIICNGRPYRRYYNCLEPRPPIPAGCREYSGLAEPIDPRDYPGGE
ncbi:MAG TPA: RHS repeat-associated core domain-containing protein, partial [bacterium]